MTKADILAQFPFFGDCAPATRNQMRERAVLVKMEEGSFYVCEGQETGRVALVGAGSLRVYKTGASGREINLYRVLPGEICLLNLLCVLTGISSPATAVVEEGATALSFRAEDFKRWVGTEKAVREEVFRLMAVGVTEIMALVEEVSFKKLDVRLAEYLDTRMPGTGNGGAVLETTHEKIAADVGSAREVVSRLLKEFERQGAVVLKRGRVELKNRQILQAYTGSR